MTNSRFKILREYPLAFGAILIAVLLFWLWFSFGWRLEVSKADLSCVKAEREKVQDISLEPILKSGVSVRKLAGFYNCNQPKRDDIVSVGFKTLPNESFIFQTKVLPEDKIEFAGENLKINNLIIKNSRGEPYLFSSFSQRLINIPLENGEVAQGRFLVFSNEANSYSYDSRTFAFVEKDHLKAKIVWAPGALQLSGFKIWLKEKINLLNIQVQKFTVKKAK